MSDGDEEQPVGRIEPTNEEVYEIRDELADQEFEAALDRIEEFEAEEPLDEDWVGYFRGLALLGTRELDAAFEAFQDTFSRVSSASRDDAEPARFRVAAKCLKKMGWYHRRGRGYERAYACHSMEYDIVDEYGSNLELHDAALSLDVVAYNLRTPQISKLWLDRSVEAAEAIDNEAYRVKALGLSWNNLAGTLCDLESFEEAAEAAEKSLEHWTRFEELEGAEENRAVWARHIIGDAYKRWGDHLGEAGEDEEAREKLEHAREVLEEAVEEAESREMEAEEMADIRGKLEDVRASLAEVGRGEAAASQSEGGAGSEEEAAATSGGEDSDEEAEE